MRTLVVIPARLASSRLPEKMLLDRTGKPLIQHTYQQACKSRQAAQVVVATDHQRIYDVVQGFGGQAIMTSPDHQSGSSRAAEVAEAFPGFDLVCNVQGDEPEIEPAAIDQAIEIMLQGISEGSDPMMATLATPIRDRTHLEDPGCVKVTMDQKNRALYFSRSVIPHPREFSEDLLQLDPPVFFQHVGLYVYRRDFLLRWDQMPESRWERLERLEQLRVLDAGFEIMVGIIPRSQPGIDTMRDYEAFVSRTINC